jgi:hypothetical protein
LSRFIGFSFDDSEASLCRGYAAAEGDVIVPLKRDHCAAMCAVAKLYHVGWGIEQRSGNQTL